MTRREKEAEGEEEADNGVLVEARRRRVVSSSLSLSLFRWTRLSRVDVLLRERRIMCEAKSNALSLSRESLLSAISLSEYLPHQKR